MINTEFKSVIELVKAFPDEDTCVKHLEQLRWNGNVVSPFDPSSKVYVCKGNKYRCKNTGKYFNVRTQTLFDNTKVDLQTWFVAIYLVTAHKKGISSLQLGRDLNVTQKTAWFMLQRIRNCFGITDNNDEDGKLGGGGQAVEVDETYVGGKLKNMTNSKRKAHKEGKLDSNSNKTPIMGYAVRGGELRLVVVPNRKELMPNVLQHVSNEAVLITDAAGMYPPIAKYFAGHEVIDHSNQEYVRGSIHTNMIEGVFSLFDRMVIGTYHYISPKHMQKYADELSFRYNSRDINGCARFNLLLKQSTKRLTYQNLIK
ncbi:MAG: IS1595 family transposase [Chitinophagaceae bacterium]